jgi:hypothetical protein
LPQISLKTYSFIVESHYFFFNIFSIFNIFIYSTSFKSKLSLITFYKKLKYLLEKQIFNTSSNILISKNITNFIVFKKPLKQGFINNYRIPVAFVKPSKIILKSDCFIEWKLFSIFFFLNYSLFDYRFKTHANYKLFYLTDNTQPYLIIDTTKFLSRWKDSYYFLFNIFFYNCTPAVFGSFVFKKEILALNWHFNFFDINLWRYYFFFFCI